MRMPGACNYLCHPSIYFFKKNLEYLIVVRTDISAVNFFVTELSPEKIMCMVSVIDKCFFLEIISSRNIRLFDYFLVQSRQTQPYIIIISHKLQYLNERKVTKENESNNKFQDCIECRSFECPS